MTPEEIIKQYRLGPDSRVKFKGDPQQYWIKNISADRKNVFVHINGAQTYRKLIKNIIQVDNKKITKEVKEKLKLPRGWKSVKQEGLLYSFERPMEGWDKNHPDIVSISKHPDDEKNKYIVEVYIAFGDSEEIEINSLEDALSKATEEMEKISSEDDLNESKNKVKPIIKEVLKELSEGTWSLKRKDIPLIIKKIELLKDEAYDIIGDDQFHEYLDKAIERAKYHMSDESKANDIDKWGNKKPLSEGKKPSCACKKH
jgi:hypothetical protein